MSTVQSSKKATKSAKTVVSPAPVAAEPTSVSQDVSSTTVEVKVQNKRKPKTATVEAVPEPVVATPVPAPAAATPEPAVAAVAAVAAVEATVSTPVVEVEESSEDSYETYDSVHKALCDLDKEFSNLQKRRVQLNKIAQKKFTQLSKQHKKRSKGDGKSTKRSVSGFNKPAHVPAAFCAFLGLNPAEQLPRTNITALLYKSIKEKNLLNENDRREVLATPELRSLLLMTEGENLRFENFQHYVSRVYKADAVLLSAATDGSASDSGSASASAAE